MFFYIVYIKAYYAYMRDKYTRHFLDVYKRNKDVFIRPKFRWFFGKWRSEPNLPVWRRGPQIRWGKYGEIDEEWNWAKLESAEWSVLGKQNHPILSKIIKKPVWQLPIWLAFHWYNRDVYCGTKWEDDDFRFEFPPHITFVFFGLAISVTAYLPQEDKDDWLINDQYWESMFAYEYCKGDLKATNDSCGWYNRPGKEGFRFKFEPRFLKKEEDRIALKQIQDEALPQIVEKYEKEDKEYQENHLFAVSVKISNVDNTTYDGWFTATFNDKMLVFENEEDRDKAYDNIKKEVQRKKNGELKKFEYVKTFADKRYVDEYKTCKVNKTDLIDKNIDISENAYEQ